MLSESGAWQFRRLSDWSPEGSGGGSLGAHQSGVVASPDARAVTTTNGNPTIPVWPTDRTTDYLPGTEPFDAHAPLSETTAVALSYGGTALAAGDTGTVYVSPVIKSSAPAETPVAMTGNGSINNGALQFVGDGNHVLSASGDTIARWDLTQPDRLARAQPTALSPPCDGCAGALAAISPDGSRIAMLNNTGGQLLIQPLDGSSPPQAVPAATPGAPLWDGDQLLVSANGAGANLPGDVRALPPLSGRPAIVASALSPDRGRVTLVSQSGTIFVQDLATGKVIQTVRGPRNFAAVEGAAYAGTPAIDPADGLVALDDGGSVLVVDVSSGRVIARHDGIGAMFVSYSGSRLLLQTSAGDLEVWNARGTSLERVIPGDESYSVFPPIGDPAGDRVARQRSDGTVVILDLNSGTTLATIPSPLPPSDGLKIGLAFSPDGSHLVSIIQSLTFNSSEIVDRDLSVPTLIRSACTTAGRSLTASDWRTYVGGALPGDLACR